MYDIIHDRIFWIYFVVTFFFIIIGVGSIITSNDPYMLVLMIFWLLSSVGLMILAYHASVKWGPKDESQDEILVCVIDVNSGCFDADNRVWLFVNLLFIALLIVSVLWAAELGNSDAGPLKQMSGILVILGGLLLCGLSSGSRFMNHDYIRPFWVAVGYILIWFGLTLYVVLTTD